MAQSMFDGVGGVAVCEDSGTTCLPDLIRVFRTDFELVGGVPHGLMPVASEMCGLWEGVVSEMV